MHRRPGPLRTPAATFRPWTGNDSGRSTSIGSTRRNCPRSSVSTTASSPRRTPRSSGRSGSSSLTERAYTYVPEGSTFSVQPGTAAATTVVELSLDAWCAFTWELKTCFALLYADQLTVRRGSFGQMARWEPALRAAFSDQAVFDLDHPAPLEDDGGRDLDLTRSFTLDDPVDEIRDFLHQSRLCASPWCPRRRRGRRPDGRRHGRARSGPTRRPEIVVDDGRRA